MLDIAGFRLRAAFFKAVRNFFWQKGFLEVDTPLRLPLVIPEANIVPINADGLYLQASPELCMKMILAEGAERIFQICPSFRKNERGRRHSEEFTMLEWYRKDADYFQLMEDCKELITAIVDEMKPYVRSPFSGGAFDGEWEKLSVAEAFARYSPVSLDEALKKDLFDELLVEYIEPNLGVNTPLFLYDYPVALGSLARVSAKDCRWAERFELYINGVELANGFSELSDEKEQRQRFSVEIETIERLFGRKAIMPENFLQKLPQLGEAAGIALGLERLLMLLLNKDELGEVQGFNLDKDFC